MNNVDSQFVNPVNYVMTETKKLQINFLVRNMFIAINSTPYMAF